MDDKWQGSLITDSPPQVFQSTMSDPWSYSDPLPSLRTLSLLADQRLPINILEINGNGHH